MLKKIIALKVVLLLSGAVLIAQQSAPRSHTRSAVVRPLPVAGGGSAPQCAEFTQDEGFWGPCTFGPNITHQVTNGYLQVADDSNASALCSGAQKVGGGPSPYTGDWTQKASCTTFCMDVQVENPGTAPNGEIQPRFQVRKGNVVATFRANQKIKVADGWQRMCAPVATISPGEALPSNSDGSWTIGNSTSYNPDWNTVITDVETVVLAVDFSPSPTEVINYDNLCIGSCDELTDSQQETYEPCCPTFFDSDRLSSLISYNLQGTNPYVLKFATNGNLDNQMNSYVDYAHSLDPAINDMRLLLLWTNCNQNTQPGSPLNPPSCGIQSPIYYVKWTGGSSAPTYHVWGSNQQVSAGTVFNNAQHQSVVNNRYRVIAAPYNNTQSPLTASKKCGASMVDYNAMVFGRMRDGVPRMIERTGRIDERSIRSLRVSPELRREWQEILRDEPSREPRVPQRPDGRRRN